MKKGFIAMSLVYTFFILFVAIMLAILVNYAHTRTLVVSLNNEIIVDLEANVYW